MKTIIVTLITSLILLSGCSQKEPEPKQDLNATHNTDYANVNHIDFIQELALHDAVRAKDMDQVKLLVLHKSDVNYKDQYGYSPLHIAVRMDDYNASEYLIKNGASVNTTDRYGDTPLLDSTRDNYTEISKLLICYGADRRVADRYDMTPLHYSAKNKNKLISEMLLAKDLQPYCAADMEQPEALEMPPVVEEPAMEEPMIAEEPVMEEPAMLEEAPIDQIPLSEVPEFQGLYEALQEEFQNDFEPWNAELTRDDLLFRFNNPVALFERGENNLKPGFTDILSDFFPRYLKVLAQYKENISEVRVEGHTSSEYSSATSDEERYRLNKILSTQRAVKTRNYAVQTAVMSPNVDSMWVEETFQPYGMAYDNLIFNPDGTENKEASRRVDFKIIRK